jgi:translation initiation factor IF-2
MVTAGDDFVAVDDEKKAKLVAEMRQKMARDTDLAKTSKVSLEDLYQKIEKGDVRDLNVVVKADTSGSVEVLSDTLVKLSTPKVSVKVIHGAVGGITENDIMLAAASSALVIGFNVRPDTTARTLAERQRIDVRLYDVIYHLTEDVQKAMAGLLAPKKVEKYLGRAEVRQVFALAKAGNVAGCGVIDGKILRSATVRLIRDGVPVYTGRLSSLKRFKDDAREVAQGLECGMMIENFNDIKVGDLIEAFTVEEVAATLE